MSVADKVVIVTGGGRGIGRASALALGRGAARVVVADRQVEAAEAVAAEIASAGGVASGRWVDVSRPEACEELVALARAAHGRVDVLVHCAGVAPRRPVLEMSDEEWHGVLDVNLHGTFYVTRAAARVMAEQGSGAMVLFASDRGTYGLAGGAHYAASKGAVIAYMKSLALELGPRGVTVNAVNPGTTDTPMARGTLTEEEWRGRWSQDPLGRLSLPEDIAEIVLFLAGPASRFMTGQLVTTRMRFG